MDSDVPVNNGVEGHSALREVATHPRDGVSVSTPVVSLQHSEYETDILGTNSTLPQAGSSEPDDQLNPPDDDSDKPVDTPITFEEHSKLCEEYPSPSEIIQNQSRMALLSSG